MRNYPSSSALQSLEENLASILSTFLPQPDPYHLLKTLTDQRSNRAQILREEIEEIELSIQSVSAIAHQVKVLLESLLNRRSNLIHALQSPVHALPTELMQYIFEIYMEINGRDSRLQAAVILSHVCSIWRSITLTTPNLWSIVKVSSAKEFVEIIKRSRPLPLDLSLAYLPEGGRSASMDGYTTNIPWEVRFEDQDLERLAALQIPRPFFLGNLIPKESKLLNLAYLEVTGMDYLNIRHVIPSALRSTRLLKFNLCSGLFVRDAAKGIWPQLQQLDICDCSPFVANVALKVIDAPHLERLEFRSIDQGSLTDHRFPFKPGVRSLRISDSAGFVVQLRQWIGQFPKLESLELHLTEGDTSGKWWELLPLCNTVRNLVISSPPSATEDWIFLANVLNSSDSLPALCSLRIEISALLSMRTPHVDLDPEAANEDLASSGRRIREALLAAFVARVSQHGRPMLERLSLPREIVGDDPLHFSQFAREFYAVG
ncbi:hypothetical protein DL93DRAFT_2158691 [Clavulina sp. PMI_390]|nr:hypothetical protein DL93DRAFT_2158691 [Clavulina sp. PMI_390]